MSAFTSRIDRPDIASTIQRVAPLLLNGSLLNGATLDVVTLGMPVRYGWDPSGLGKLLHIVNHRTLRTDGKTWLSKMELPQITMEMPIAWGGDYVQELAVAGSDVGPQTDAAQRRFEAELDVVVEPLRSALGIPGENNAGLLGYLRSIAKNN